MQLPKSRAAVKPMRCDQPGKRLWEVTFYGREFWVSANDVGVFKVYDVEKAAHVKTLIPTYGLEQVIIWIEDNA